MTQLRRSGVNVGAIGDDAMLRVFSEYGKGNITKAAIEEILKREPKDGADVERIIKSEKLERLRGRELELAIKEAGAEGGREERLRRIMSKHRLNVDGDELGAALK
jgi:Glu-tRNA(Gln) amidotransferase subunit E-like FAD-binding protein